MSVNLRRWYIYDLLRKYWRNSGDSKSYDFIKRSRLIEGVQVDAFVSAVDAWFQESLQSRNKDLQAASRTVIKTIAHSRLRDPWLENGKKFKLLQLVDSEDMRGSGITPANPANVLLKNPDTGRTFDPCGQANRVLQDPSEARDFFTSRYELMRRLLTIELFGKSALEQTTSEAADTSLVG